MEEPLLGASVAAGAAAAAPKGAPAASEEGVERVPVPASSRPHWRPCHAAAAAAAAALLLLGVLTTLALGAGHHLPAAAKEVLVEAGGGRTSAQAQRAGGGGLPAGGLQADATRGRVRVEVYGMAGCPFTRAFIEGPLSEAMATAPDLVDLRLHPFGNSYYVVEGCGGTAAGMPFTGYFKAYDPDVRKCWDERCGEAAREPAPDCFSGDLVCQHGVTDCLVTTAWACAESLAKGDASSYLPFVQCTARRFLGVTSEAAFEESVQQCASTSGLSGEKVVACSLGTRGRALLNAQGRATVLHAGVPYVLVDGRLLEDTSCVACGDGLMQRVCEAARGSVGADNAVCDAIIGKA
uniref:Uncharacterized protein n=1 Tax=Alexandrium monilatum TaxID=311494 RepID=A0A7S4V7D1_9DINO